LLGLISFSSCGIQSHGCSSILLLLGKIPCPDLSKCLGGAQSNDSSRHRLVKLNLC